MLTLAIVNYETADLTARCVRSVLESPPTEPFETIVVDNGSSPTTVDALRALEGVRLVETGVNGGFAAAVNRCMREADSSSDVVLVLNSDTELRPRAADALAVAARRDGVGLAAPILLDRHGDIQRSAYRRFPTLWTSWVTLCFPLAYLQTALERIVRPVFELSVAEHEAGTRPMHVMGAAMGLRRAAWDEVGPFDTRFFMYLEETEWQGRLRAAGWEVELVPEARVRHLHRGGDLAIIAPSLTLLDSTRAYFGARGHSDTAIRAVLASALLLSWVSLLLLKLLTRRNTARGELVAASLLPEWRALLHTLRGRTVPRPNVGETAAPRRDDQASARP